MRTKLNAQNISNVSKKYKKANEFREIRGIVRQIKKAAKEGRTRITADVDWCDMHQITSLFEKRGFNTQEYRRHISVEWR